MYFAAEHVLLRTCPRCSLLARVCFCKHELNELKMNRALNGHGGSPLCKPSTENSALSAEPCQKCWDPGSLGAEFSKCCLNSAALLVNDAESSQRTPSLFSMAAITRQCLQQLLYGATSSLLTMLA